MSVVVSVEDTGVCRKQVTVEVPADAVEAETRKVVKAWAGQVRLPGFRKGKAPAQLLRKRFREDIDREVVERLVPAFWEKARDEQELVPFGQPQLQEVDDLTDGEPLRFVAVVEVRPPVEIGDVDPGSFTLPEVDVEPSDEEVDAALDGVRHQVGEWKDAERAAARGDLATVRIVEETEKPAAEEAAEAGAEQGAEGEAGPAAAEEPAAEEGDEVQVEVGDPNVWEELSLAVTGLEAGQQGRFTRRPAEGSEAAPRTFRIRVEKVRERDLPPLDDALAKRLGDFETVDELRRTMADKLRHDRRHERDAKRREALMEQLRQRHPVLLPEGVLHEETQSLLNEYAQDVARRGVDPRQAGIDWNQMGEQLKPAATRRLHDRLLLDAVADRRGVEVGAAEVEGAIGSIARSQNITTAQVRQALGDGTAGLERQIRREKAMKWLLGEEAETAHEHDHAHDHDHEPAAVDEPQDATTESQGDR
jgi:trigger factor